MGIPLPVKIMTTFYRKLPWWPVETTGEAIKVGIRKSRLTCSFKLMFTAVLSQEFQVLPVVLDVRSINEIKLLINYEKSGLLNRSNLF